MLYFQAGEDHAVVIESVDTIATQDAGIVDEDIDALVAESSREQRHRTCIANVDARHNACSGLRQFFAVASADADDSVTALE